MSGAGIKKILFLSVILSGLLAGCSQKEMPRPTPEEGKYLIYYLNTATTKLVPREYEAEATDKEALVDELMEQFLHVPKELDCQAALIDKVAYQGSRQEEQVLYLYFDVNYTGMKPEREILCRAALTRTLTQIPGVDYINIYCGDQPLMDRQGNPVGMLASTDFIMNTSNVNAYEKTELTLYFADSTGEKLVKEQREVVHNVTTSREKLVVEQLIAGPDRPGINATLPKDTKLLNVSVNENVCYLNFDASFLNNSLDVKEYIPVYSIVNSLAAVSSVNKVQIAVNGSQDVMFRDSISLNQLFERNLDYNAENEDSPQ